MAVETGLCVGCKCAVCRTQPGVLSNGEQFGHIACVRGKYYPEGDVSSELRTTVAILFAKTREPTKHLRAPAEVLLARISDHHSRLCENRESESRVVNVTSLPLVEAADRLRLLVLGLKTESAFSKLAMDVDAAAGRIVEIIKLRLFHDLPFCPDRPRTMAAPQPVVSATL